MDPNINETCAQAAHEAARVVLNSKGGTNPAWSDLSEDDRATLSIAADHIIRGGDGGGDLPKHFSDYVKAAAKHLGHVFLP